MIIYDLDFVDDTKMQSLTGGAVANSEVMTTGNGIKAVEVINSVEGADYFIDPNSDLFSLIESLGINLGSM